ncbi:MAG: sortase [Rubrobacteraceae bacterium]|nr:sortase [Rubrobacteraceae bacterium]
MALVLVCAGAVAVFALLGGASEPAAAVKSSTEPEIEPLVRADPGFEPWKEKAVTLTEAETEPKTQPTPDPEPSTPESEPVPPEPKLVTLAPETEPEPAPAPQPVFSGEPPEPTAGDIAYANGPRHYELPDGAVMGLTVEVLGIHDVPVFDSVGEWALGHGVGHHPETSMPWSDAPQRNVYLARHRLGFPGTDSHLIFYRLGELGAGDEILLKDRDGKKYRYRVSETFKADPEDSWVMGQLRDRDMVTLQTCSGPNWERRLIVRADRV